MDRSDIYANRTRGELIEIIERSIDELLEGYDGIEDIVCKLKNIGLEEYEIAEVIRYRYVLGFVRQ